MSAVVADTPLLEVRNVSRYFGNVIALKDISMSVYQGEVTAGQRTLTIWDRSGNAANHVFKIVRVSPDGKKKLLLDARPNEFGNVVTVLTFKVGYHYDVRVKDVTTGESSRLRLEVPEPTS